MNGYPQIRTEAVYEARLEQLTALLGSIMEYENRVHPIGPATRWPRICFRWDQAWRWIMLPALIGGVVTAAAMLLVLVQ